MLSCDAFPDENPEAEHITSLVSGLTNELFRRHPAIQRFMMADGIVAAVAIYLLCKFKVANLARFKLRLWLLMCYSKVRTF